MDELTERLRRFVRTRVANRQDAEAVDARDRLSIVEAAIATLPRRCREVFLMHRLDGMSYSQIAKSSGISISAVEKHIARACLLIDAKVNGERPRP
jgi:RNA polymerase sigma factor (sigma-70 family)